MEAVSTKILNVDKSNWALVKFGDVVDEPRDIVKDIVAENIEHVVGLEHIDPENIHLLRSASIEDSTTFTKKFSKGDVLFGRRRAYLKKAALASFDGICSGDITVLRVKQKHSQGLFSSPTPELLPKLLPFIVNNDKFFDYAVKHSAGGLSPRVKFRDLSNYEFLLPPKEQQAQLADLLWAIDEVIERENEIANINKGLMNGFVEDVIHGRYLNDLGMKNTKIGDIPKNWDVVNMEDVVTVNDGAHHTPTYTNIGIPFLRVTDIQDEFIDLSKVKFVSEEEHQELCKRCKPERGDILYSKNGTIGISKIVDWDWEFSTFVSLALLKIKDKNVLDINYLKLILDSVHTIKEIRRRGKQGTITNLHLEEIRIFRIPLPSIDKQREIAESTKKINTLIDATYSKIVSSKALQKSLINQIF
jgi:type I restriction enzyme, S subunit